MPLNNEYKRYFIILQEDDKGYEMSAGKIPTGYAKIEIKNGRGKLTAYAQNVKYGEKADYRMLLIAPAKKTAVDMGKLMVDNTGRGELNVEFDADNVMKSSMGISDFMVAAVQANTATPLSGYTGRDKMQWKNSYHIINKPQERIDKKQQVIEEVVAPILTMPQLPMVDVEEENIIEFLVDENEVKPAIVKSKKEPIPVQEVTEPVVLQPVIEEVQIPEVEPIKPVEMLPLKPLFEAQTEIKAKFIIETEEKHEKPQYEYKIECPEIDYKKYYYDEDSECDSDSDSDSDDRDKNKKTDKEKNSYYTSPLYRRLEKVLGRLKEYEPFDNDDDSRQKWFKIEDDVYLLNNATIPFMGSMMPLGYPFMSNECVMMIGRKDYIIGVKYGKDHKDKKFIKEIMFGIPGMNNKHEEKYYSMRGFTDYRSHKSKNYGYWIMTVDVMTGEIMMK